MLESGQTIPDQRVIDLARRFSDLSERLNELERQGQAGTEADEAAWAERDRVIAELEGAEPSTPAGVAAQAAVLHTLASIVGYGEVATFYPMLVQRVTEAAAKHRAPGQTA